MKTLRTLIIVSACFMFTHQPHAQGTLVYDQQSSIEGVNGEFGLNFTLNPPTGQSFTPSLSAVGFIRLRIFNAGTGGSIYLNLRSNSISGELLGSTTPVSIPTGFNGYTDFFFSLPVSVIPEQMYYFQPVAESGTGWFLSYHNGFNYTRGAMIVAGNPQAPYDLWFREGIIAPEPSALSLLLAGFGVAAVAHRPKPFKNNS